MSAKSAVLRLYRQLMRLGKKVPDDFQFRQPGIGQRSWGYYEHTKSGQEHQNDLIQEVLPLPVMPSSLIKAASYHALVRDNFKAHKDLGGSQDPSAVANHVSTALKALRIMNEQLYYGRCNSSTTTEGVHVDATSAFSRVAQHPNGHPTYVFTYLIRITNQRAQAIKVMGRGWTIRNDRGEIVGQVELKSTNAVVGQQPVLPPNSTWEYYSGTDLDTVFGLMQGSLLVHVLGRGNGPEPSMEIQAKVTPFPLRVPELQQQQLQQQGQQAGHAGT